MTDYFRQQAELHRKKTFREEFLRILKLAEIGFDPKYIDDDTREYVGGTNVRFAPLRGRLVGAAQADMPANRPLSVAAEVTRLMPNQSEGLKESVAGGKRSATPGNGYKKKRTPQGCQKR